MRSKSLSFEQLESREMFAGIELSGNVFQRSAQAIRALYQGSAVAHQQVNAARGSSSSSLSATLRQQSQALVENAGQITQDAITGDIAGLRSNIRDAALIGRQAALAARANAQTQAALSGINRQINAEVSSAVRDQSLVISNLLQGKITVKAAREQQVAILQREQNRLDNGVLDSAISEVTSEYESRLAAIQQRIANLRLRDGGSSSVLAGLATFTRKR